jgi:hypothetical protein
MKTKKLQLWFALLLILTLNSCGDDDNNDNNNNSGGDTDIVGEAGIMQNINTTNLSTYAFPWYFQDDVNNTGCGYAELTDGLLKRWDKDHDGLIPVKFDNVPFEVEALDAIEDKLGFTLFDRTSIASTPNDQVSRGIIFSEGTASGPNPATDCGHVSEGVGTFSYPYYGENTEYSSENVYLEYDNDGNIIGYDYPFIESAYDEQGNIVGKVLEDTPYIFDDDNLVIGLVAQEEELIYDIDGNAICTTLYNRSLYDANGIVIGANAWISGDQEDMDGGAYVIKFRVVEDPFYDTTGRINTVLYVHIGSAECQNEITLNLVIHEVGHALGLGPHFEGFGYGPAVDGNFWNVLYTLYHNPVASDEDSIDIMQIEF